jgi:glycosyltransferase involved in cell wall biosynthesis
VCPIGGRPAARGRLGPHHPGLGPGSTDGTREWVRDNRALGYEAVLAPDRGQTHALIKGFDRASADVMGWLNADDVLEPHALRKVSEAFASDPALVMVAGCCLLIDGEGSLMGIIPTPPRPSFQGC